MARLDHLFEQARGLEGGDSVCVVQESVVDVGRSLGLAEGGENWHRMVAAVFVVRILEVELDQERVAHILEALTFGVVDAPIHPVLDMLRELRDPKKVPLEHEQVKHVTVNFDIHGTCFVGPVEGVYGVEEEGEDDLRSLVVVKLERVVKHEHVDILEDEEF